MKKGENILLRNIADRYSRVTGKATYTILEVVEWAIDSRELEASADQLADLFVKHCCLKMRDALRSDTYSLEETGNGRPDEGLF